MTVNKNIRVLLVEDDSRLSDSVVQYLELHDFVCDVAADGMRGLHLLDNNSYDVIVSDISMPNLSGLDMCKRLRDQGKDIALLLITSHSALDDKVAGFEAGADDYLVKPFELKELLMRVRALAKRRSGQVQVLTIKELDIEVNFSRRELKRQGREVKLSKSAWAIAESLIRHWPHPVSKEDLQYALWGDDPPESDGLKVHIHNLRQRLDKPFERDLVHSVPGFGFVLQNQEISNN